MATFFSHTKSFFHLKLIRVCEGGINELLRAEEDYGDLDDVDDQAKGEQHRVLYDIRNC